MDPQQATTDQKPSKAYFQLSTEKSISSTQQPKKQLLILDLNGTLISRIKCRARAGRAFYARPHFEVFLKYIFEHFEVMVWSSATQQNVNKMCHIFTAPPMLIWSRDHLKLDKRQYYSNVDTIKDLELVWEHFEQEYNATNTIALDDSESKLVLQPFNLIHIRTFHHEDIREGLIDNELIKVISYLEALRSQSNVANYVRNKPFLSHKYIVPEDKDLDLAMQYFTRAGKFAEPYPSPKKGLKRRKEDHDDHSVSIKDEVLDDGVEIKPEPVDDVDDNMSIKLEAEEDGILVARQQDEEEVEGPPRNKLKRMKKEKLPRHLRKPRHKKHKKKAKPTSDIPVRPQTDKKLKSIQESIKQRKQKKEKKSVKMELQAIKIEP